MEKDVKSKTADLISSLENLAKELKEAANECGKELEKIIIQGMAGDREERIAKLATNLVSTHASLIFYSGCGAAYFEGKAPLHMRGLQDNAKRYLEEAKEFEYLQTIKKLSEALAAEVKNREKPVTIYHEAYY